MKKKNSNKFSLSVLLAGILGCVGLSFLLYFVITGVNGNNNNVDDNRLNLDSENISYLAQVGHMDSITESEAKTIKSDIQTKIDEKMNDLELEPDIDYTVNNLNDIKEKIRLDSINVTVDAVESSIKVKGELVVELNGQEDISDRSSNPLATINVPTEDGLSNIQASNLKLEISLNVVEILTQGQITEEGIDYQIVGLDLIVSDAIFTDYNGKVSVEAISNSTKLKGSFLINFQLVNS